MISSLGVKQGKVKEVLKTLETNKVNTASNILLVVKDKDELTLRATSNIANVKLVRSTYLNVFDLMNADQIVILEDAIAEIENWLLVKENK